MSLKGGDSILTKTTACFARLGERKGTRFPAFWAHFHPLTPAPSAALPPRRMRGPCPKHPHALPRQPRTSPLAAFRAALRPAFRAALRPALRAALRPAFRPAFCAALRAALRPAFRAAL